MTITSGGISGGIGERIRGAYAGGRINFNQIRSILSVLPCLYGGIIEPGRDDPEDSFDGSECSSARTKKGKNPLKSLRLDIGQHYPNPELALPYICEICPVFAQVAPTFLKLIG